MQIAVLAVFCNEATSAEQSLAVVGIANVTALALPAPVVVTVIDVPQGVCKLLFGKKGCNAVAVIADV